MRRLSIACLTAATALLATSLPSSGATGRSRAVSQVYAAPNGFWIVGHGDEDHGNPGGVPLVPPMTFTPKLGERHLRVTAQDASGLPVMVHIRQPGTGAHHHGVDVAFCRVGHPGVVLASGVPVEISVFTGVCANHTYGVATSGTVTATFSKG